MLKAKHRTVKLSSPYQTIISIIASWLLASSVMNFVMRENIDYFSVEYAGLEGLLPLFLLFVVFVPASLAVIRKFKGLDAAGRLLFFSWVAFSFSLMRWFEGTTSSVTLLIPSITSLILARDIFISAWRTKWLSDVILSCLGIFMLLFNLYAIPWRELSLMLAEISTSVAAALVIMFTALVLSLSVIFRLRRSFISSDKSVFAVALISMLIQIFLSGRILYARFETLSTPTYDFNLFAQMFHSMAETFHPITTLERNMPLSHFKVHISPVYYLMLPFYAITRSPATLNVLQAIIVGSGMIPAVLIARHFRLNARIQAAYSVIYAFSTALITSGLYDLHENCFLVPVLLWLILFIEKKSNPGIAIFTILTLAIKEDAALYIWALSAFIILDRKMVWQGLGMLFASGAYFIGAIRYLNEFGEGAMTGRFKGLIVIPEWSLLAVPYAVVRNPGFILSKIFAKEKLPYILQMLSPLGFMPLFSRKLTRWILIIPFVLLNLMVDYKYQYDMRFQYNYGSYVLLLYMALLFLKDMRDSEDSNGEEGSANPYGIRHIAVTIILAVAISSGLMASASYLAAYEHYPKKLAANSKTLTSMKQVMDQIPKESSVLATCYLTGYLSGRDILYDIDYNLDGKSYYRADYIVIDLRPSYEGDHESLVPMFISDGYEQVSMKEDEILLLKRTGER